MKFVYKYFKINFSPSNISFQLLLNTRLIDYDVTANYAIFLKRGQNKFWDLVMGKLCLVHLFEAELA